MSTYGCSSEEILQKQQPSYIALFNREKIKIRRNMFLKKVFAFKCAADYLSNLENDFYFSRWSLNTCSHNSRLDIKEFTVCYRWRQLPQVSFLSRQTRVCHVFCRDENMLVATKLLSRHRNYTCGSSRYDTWVVLPTSDPANRHSWNSVIKFD